MLTEIQGCTTALCDSKKQDVAEPAKGTKTTVVHLMRCGTANMEQGRETSQGCGAEPRSPSQKGLKTVQVGLQTSWISS